MKAIAAVALLCAAVAVSAVGVSAQYAPNVPYSAVYDANAAKWSIAAGCDGAGWSACATMDDGVWSTGWYTLNVRSNPQAGDEYQAFGAGYVEGALTAQHQWDAWRTWVNGTAYVWPDDAVKQFALRQDQWVRASAANPTDGNAAYWAQVNAVYKQWDGLMAGYNDNVEPDMQLAYDQWLAYQLQEEIGDIMVALNLSNAEDVTNPTAEHCSSLVRLTPDHTRLFASHDTWSGFSSMLRIFKHFDLHFTSVPGTAATGVSFSSFPGAIPSIDDYYVTSANLAIMETTNGVMNNTLYQLYTTTQTVPYWARVTVANRMAGSGSEWMQWFGLYNSGTYNNQWIVVDYKQFSSGAANPLAPGALWIGEQIPGFLVTQDMTTTLLGQGFWSSYNIPYFPFVYNISGYWPFYEKYGNTYSWAHCARANIFRRDAPKVATLDDMKHIMRYNEWQTDPLSLQDACRGISARCDLNPPWASDPLNSYSAFGAIDSKICTDQLSPARATLAVCGPTWDSQAPFAWTKQWEGVPRYGQPDVFDFDWTTLVPQQP